MKNFALMSLVGMALAGCAQGPQSQVPKPAIATPHEKVPRRVDVAEAIKTASSLRLGMEQADADRFLQSHGITSHIVDTNGEVLAYSFAVGSCTGWSIGYPLQSNCTLAVSMEPKKVNGFVKMDGHWGDNGLLNGASIQSNGVDIASIALTKRP